MKKRDDDLALFLQDLKLDGVNLKNLPCDSEDHNENHCNICRFFENCPFPKKNQKDL